MDSDAKPAREMTGSDNARVSAAIVIPAFNAAATIIETLRAVQACPGVAKLGGVFLCDDASTDNTPKLAVNTWIGMPKLTILQNEQRLGERSTVNAAFEQLRKQYEWIFILHADDVVKKNWLDLYFQRIKAAEPRVASICSSYDVWYPKANRIEPGENDFSRKLEVIRGGRESVLDSLKAGCWWHISGCAIHVERFFEIGRFRPHMPQLGDFEWMLRCLKLGYDVEYIPRTTMLYRMHSESVSANSFKRGQELIERLELFRAYYRDSYLTEGELRAVRIGVFSTALKRIVKQLVAGKPQDSRNLLSVCWHALRG
jgi:glycosyltransferase involved in cell wall biosynthesis